MARPLTPSQERFVRGVAGRTGLNTKFLSAWVISEQGDGASGPARAREAEGNFNWLNIGPGRVYKSVDQAVDATVKTLHNGYYGGILKAAKTGDPHAQINALVDSPWDAGHYRGGGILRGLVGEVASVRGGGGGSTSRPSSSGGGASSPVQVPQAQIAAPSAALTTALLAERAAPRSVGQLALPAFAARPTLPQGAAVLGSTPAPGRSDALAGALAQIRAAVPAVATASGGGSSSSGSSASSGSSSKSGGGGALPKGHSPLFELFYNGPGGINVKNGQREPIGFVSGHTDHVHVAAGPNTVVALGKLAQRMGLHVGENPHFGGVNPVHVQGSYHYRKGGEAIDVSGSAALMRRFNHEVARRFGV